MVRESRIASLVPLLLAASPAELPAGAVVTVGLGGDFQDIQQAVHAAGRGDIVLVAPGSYGRVEVVGETIAIVAPAGADCERFLVRNLGPDDIVLASGLRAVGDADEITAEEGRALWLLDNQGVVLLQDFELVDGNSPSTIETSDAVFLTNCTAMGVGSSAGLQLLASSVALYHSTCQGGEGGGAGLVAHSSFLFAAGSTFAGGDDSCPSPAIGGDGLWLRFGSVGYSLDCQRSAGAGMECCEIACDPGENGQNLRLTEGSSHSGLSGVARTLEVPASIQLNPSGSAPAHFAFGGVDDTAYLLWGARPGFDWTLAQKGVRIFEGPMAHTFGSLDLPAQWGPGPILFSSHLMGPATPLLNRTFPARISPRERYEGETVLLQPVMEATAGARYLANPRFVLVHR